MRIKAIVYIMASFLTLLCENAAYAGETIPVKDMGNIWVVTIDKSGSMLYGNTPASIARNVTLRLQNVMDSVNFKKDRFIFLTSGYSFSTAIGLGNELKNSESFDKSFIHQTDEKIHKFESKKEFTKYLGEMLAQYDYSHQLSFVSQIRVFSIIKAVNFLKSIKEGNTFDNLMILTITDDADQNDQWMMDYKLLKKCAPNKVQEVNDSTSKYIYNSFYERGLGNLDEVYCDENITPHIWIYQYRTLASTVVLQEYDLLNIKATNGHNLNLSFKREELEHEVINFIHVDSILINKQMIDIDASFEKTFGGEYRYDNKFKTNDIAIYGYAHVNYVDPVYGWHYKIVPFVQYDKVVSDALEQLVKVLLTTCILILVLMLIYFFYIRPRSIMFTIYSGYGTKTSVCRGFARDWPGEEISVQCYETVDGQDGGYIIKHHRNIVVEEFSPKGTPNHDELLIVSHRPLDISIDTRGISTQEDIEEVYYMRSGDYPDLLRTSYESTGFCNLQRKFRSANGRIIRWALKNVIKAKQLISKTYYYPINSLEGHSNIYLWPTASFNNKRFVIEYANLPSIRNKDIYEELANRALGLYYSNRYHPVYDIIVASYSFGNDIVWNILNVYSGDFSEHSLRDASSLVRYIEHTNSSNASVSEGFMLIKQYFSKAYHTNHIGHIEVTDESEHFQFLIKETTAPGFISFVETRDNPKNQVLYSPILDGKKTEKLVSINPDFGNGFLMISPVPVNFTEKRKSFLTQLSQTIVKNDVKSSSLLSIKKNSFEFRNINESF